jgi:hypothetical protein
LRSNWPGLFGSEIKSARSRLSLAKGSAIRAGWIEQYRQSYRVGKMAPPVEVPASIEDLL